MKASRSDCRDLEDMCDVNIHGIASAIKAGAAALDDASSEVIAATRDCWNLKNDGELGYSTSAMDDEELQQAIIEDLLLVVQWRLKGKHVGGDFNHLTRFLDTASALRVAEQLEAPMVKSMTEVSPTGDIEISPEHMQDAMDFSGFWLDGWQPLTGERVLTVGTALK